MKKYSSLFRMNRFLPRGSWPAFAVAWLMAFGWTDFAHAQTTGAVATTLGQMFCNMQVGMQNMGDLFVAIAYIAGAGFMGQSLYELVKHNDNPREKELRHILLKMGGGAALLAAPEVITTLIDTFFLVDGGNGNVSCNIGQVTPTSGNGVGLDVLVKNLVGNIKDPLVFALSVLAITAGVLFIVRGLMKASKHGVDPRTHSMTNILSNLGFGALLVVVGQTGDMIVNTLFGGSGGQAGMLPSSTVAGWAFISQLGLSGNSQFTGALEAALMFFQLVGLIAFVRGWLILKSATEGQGQATMAQGITHIIGGTLALNIYNFLQIMDSTFGTGFLT